jgi:Chs5-Arf1p-binding protein BUD7/BCH1
MNFAIVPHSCFNAFSRVDIRVDVKIPGGVNAYVIDLRGERCACLLFSKRVWISDIPLTSHEATPEIWQETYVSALLRAILYSDDPVYWVEAYRKLDPITSRESELRFLQASEALFHKGTRLTTFIGPSSPNLISGWQVGSDPEIQVATVVSNHLVSGIMKYFGDSGRYQPAANLFEKLLSREPDVASLLAKSYIGMRG